MAIKVIEKTVLGLPNPMINLLLKSEKNKIKAGMEFKDLKIGYVPIKTTLNHPGDQRRFCYYADKRKFNYEIADASETYDLVFLTQSADLSVWSEYQRGNCKIIYDFIDSYLSVPIWNIKGIFRGTAKYIGGQNRYLRLNHWKSLEAMCQRADAVVCSTAEQKVDIQPFCPNVHLILDFHFNLMRTSKTDYFTGDTFNFVWEGLPGNLKFVFEIKEVLQLLSAKYKIAFHAVTDLTYGKYMGKYGIKSTLPLLKRIFNNSHLHEWNEKTFASKVCSFDMALIPIPLNKPFGLDNSLAVGKPENKLLLFWRMGIPTVVSATAAYERAMNDCGLAMACRTSDEWFDTLEKYMNDESARREAGREGKAFVDKHYSEDIMLSQWDKLFGSVL